MKKWSRKLVEESREIDPQIYTQLIFNRGAKQYGGEKIVFQQVMLEQLDIHMKKNNLDILHPSRPYGVKN